jgi:serine phosphatase RsbU (regulator of sigma subunit)/tetratricopeptide (TPR) repeat protein
MVLPWMVQAQSLSDAIKLQYDKPDSAIVIASYIAQSSNSDSRLQSNAHEVIGIALMNKGEYAAAYTEHAMALRQREELQWKNGIGHSLNNMGLVLRKMGDPEASMEHTLRALEVAERVADTSLLTRILGNIGTIHEAQGDFDRAVDYYGKCLDLLGDEGDEMVLGNTLNNIAMIYSKQGEMDKAWNFWRRTLHIRELANDRRGLALALNNIGTLYFLPIDNSAAADSVYAMSYAIYSEMEDRMGLAMVTGSIGQSALIQGRTSLALEMCGQSYQLAYETSSIPYLLSAGKCLAEAYAETGDHRSSNRYWKKYVAIIDSLSITDPERKAALMEQRFRYDRERTRAALEREHERALAQSEITRQHQLRNMSVALGLMALILFFVQYNNYKKKQRANELLHLKNDEITVQKEEIAVKNKEITDSIEYARHLQQARLPKATSFHRHLSQWHVLYRPKDIVSGDFYWLEKVDDHVFVAVADCTGHGVPGAMVSMIGIHGLHRAVVEQKLKSPAAILDSLMKHFEEAFSNSVSEVRDGMDISLCVISPDRQTLTFAGANNPLWQVSSHSTQGAAQVRDSLGDLHLIEWKADRNSIGGHATGKAFTDKSISLHPADVFVIMSDGYADQFGGADGKKFGSKRLRSNVLSAVMEGESDLLNTSFDKWKGQQEQVDDVTIMLFRI